MWIDRSLVGAVLLLTLSSATPWLLRSRKSHHDRAAAALKLAVTADAVRRESDHESDHEGDGNLDYGMLTELSNVTLVETVLGGSPKTGHFFPQTNFDEFLWFDVTDPVAPGTPDLAAARSFE